MSDRLPTVVIVLVVLLVVAGMAFFSPRGARTTRLPAPPEFRWSIKVDGEPVDVEGKQLLNIMRGALVEPSVEVEWNGHGPGSVELSLENRALESGASLAMDDLGFWTIDYSSVGESWAATGSIVLKVNEYPRLGATAHPISVETGDGGPLDIRAVTVRLSSDEFDIENIGLSHASMWLQDAKHRALGDGISVAPRAGDHAVAGEEATEGDAKARYAAEFADGAWTLRFERPADAPLLESWPAEIMIFGDGWRGGETIEFVARGPFSAVAPDDQ